MMEEIMPNRVQWNPRYDVGDDAIDGQHRRILAQCNALADCLSGSSSGNEPGFAGILDELMADARKHFSDEEELLARCGCPGLEEHRNERDEFEYLTANIVTTANFDKVELQRFLALWWVGHIVGFGRKHRDSIRKTPLL